MKAILLKEVAKILFGIVEKSKEEHNDIQWVTTSNLLPNNVLAKYENNLSFEPSEILSVKDGDILIRRIAPSYVNYLQEASPGSYIANNLIIIRTIKRVNSKYLAYYLDKNITKIIKKAAKGTTLPTLTRQDLGEFEIILPSEKIQQLVGNLWFLEIEKIKLQEKLNDLESKKLHYLLNKFIKKTQEQQ
jgi:restriction endonuclease S subunit